MFGFEKELEIRRRKEKQPQFAQQVLGNVSEYILLSFAVTSNRVHLAFDPPVN
jgi:hypothetical protein